MMTVSFVRIDDRVLHGQIVTRWSKAKPCKGILIVDNEIANDKFQKQIYSSAAPVGIKVGIFDELEGSKRVKRAMEVTNPYFLICKSPRTLVNLINMGVNFGEAINVGPMSARADTLTVGRNCSLTDDEIAAFRELSDLGKKVEFQLIPDNTATSWKVINEKVEKLMKARGE